MASPFLGCVHSVIMELLQDSCSAPSSGTTESLESVAGGKVEFSAAAGVLFASFSFRVLSRLFIRPWARTRDPSNLAVTSSNYI